MTRNVSNKQTFTPLILVIARKLISNQRVGYEQVESGYETSEPGYESSGYERFTIDKVSQFSKQYCSISTYLVFAAAGSKHRLQVIVLPKQIGS